MSAAFIGLDLAKSVFQVHGVDVHGKVVVTKESTKNRGRLVAWVGEGG
jgi:transposase